jgi:hypothetical protein
VSHVSERGFGHGADQLAVVRIENFDDFRAPDFFSADTQ